MKMRIYFMDEAPRFGCGWRTCEVKIGRKWVYLICGMKNFKMKMKAWEGLTKKQEIVE